jgi:RNA polymerase sigma-70 factor (ECF subfamily)
MSAAVTQLPIANSARDALAGARAAARSRWPAFDVGDATFSEYVAARLSVTASLSPALLEQRVSDLYLACACGLGDPQAIAVFESLYFDEVDAVATRLNRKGARADDLRQQIRERLFLGSAEAPPKVTSYSGDGDLRSWVRVVSMRAVLNLTRGGEKERADESVLLMVPDLADDPELGFMKRLYKAEFDAAVSDGLRALSLRERNVLKYVVADGLSTLAVGTIYGVHRTTIKRWLAEAQQRFVGAVRDAMMRRLRVSRAELESILRLVQSRIDLRLIEGPVD